MCNFIRAFARDEAGVTAMEYGMIAALVCVAVVAIVGTLGRELNRTFAIIQSGLAQPVN